MKGKTSFFILITATALMILSFTACSSTDAYDGSLKKVRDAGYLLIGLDENFPPMGFKDEDGKITGFDIDVATEVCRRVGVEAQPVPINWDDKEKELNEGRIDCIWNGMSVNPERSKSMNLSEPYIKNDLVFAVLPGSDIKSLDDFDGITVGVQSGSSAEDAFKGSDYSTDVNLECADDNIELLDMLDSESIDAVCLDSIFAYYYIASNDKDYIILPNILTSEDMAVGFRKGDAQLRDEIQRQLHNMKADGSLADISKKWFGVDVTTVE